MSDVSDVSDVSDGSDVSDVSDGSERWERSEMKCCESEREWSDESTSTYINRGIAVPSRSRFR